MGTDGSAQSRLAVSWAAAEAARRATAVRVVSVNDDPHLDEKLWTDLETLVEETRHEYPEVELYPKIARGHPAAELVRRSCEAPLVVVGSRGRSPLRATLLGSVSTKVATHAHCPVVVVRNQANGAGDVVVGLDDSGYSQAALRFAFDAAAARGTELVAVQVWQPVDPSAVLPMLDSDMRDLAESAERGLAEQLAGWSEQYPTVPVRRIARQGHPVFELTCLGRDARLVVVGHRGRGGFTGLLMGSVATGVLQHATCPVAVVRRAPGLTTSPGR
ncbi:universal stress protein family [Saccharopolyspora erythraea NRRL 2338]|uniref:Universal stress protein family n=1 Tax=Saccharopolyspora erythraea (strain ATCC 11635 / DSM 40517 / JCM 4748 / NBRC 13426 / NCIMB 8594 / NRRL 2338) TaxID=405948 RepID=A4FCD9_SACEN|nr:universal stress protein family [Saccharopolyspora erythraea NRRL 2338]